MRRRIIKWIIIFLLLIGAAFWIKDRWHLTGIINTQLGFSIEEDTFTSLVYPLETDKWLSFNLLETEKIKILTNAASLLNKDSEPLQNSIYSIQYRLLDGMDKIIETRIYNFTAHLTKYKNQENNKTFTNSFFLIEPWLLFDGRILQLFTSSYKNSPKKLQVRLKTVETPIIRVFIRIYNEKKAPLSKLNTIWSRKTHETKLRLAKGNLYPLALMTKVEQMNLVERQWNVLAPQGIPDIDFNKYTVYQLKENKGTSVLDGIWNDVSMVPGIYTSAKLKTSIYLPTEGGKFRFVFKQAKSESSDENILKIVTLKWNGIGPEEFLLEQIEFDDDEFEFERDFSGGLVTLSSSIPVSVQCFWISEFEKPEITPIFSITSVYFLKPGESLGYQIAHSNKQATPFRIDLRVLAENLKGYELKKNHGAITAVYQLIDAEGSIINTDEINLERILSFYDRQKDGVTPVNEKKKVYFQLSTIINKVRIIAGNLPLLIAAYNRPPVLASRMSIPEDRYAYNRKNKNFKDWFPIAAIEHRQMIENKKITAVLSQIKANERNLLLLDGFYKRDLFYPQKNILMRRLFVTRDNNIPLKEMSGDGIFIRLQNDQCFSGIWGDGIQTFISPKIFYINKDGQDFKWTITVDGKIYVQGKNAGEFGEIQLPPLTNGRHKFYLSSKSKMRFYINNVKTIGKTVSFLRLAVSMEERNIILNFEKREEKETLSFKLFVPEERKTPLNIEVKILSDISGENINRNVNRPLKNWTNIIRHYHITPPETEKNNRIPVLETKATYVKACDPFFLLLNTDLKPVKYRIEINMNDSRGSYLMVYRVIPGHFEKRKMILTHNWEENE